MIGLASAVNSFDLLMTLTKAFLGAARNMISLVYRPNSPKRSESILEVVQTFESIPRLGHVRFVYTKREFVAVFCGSCGAPTGAWMGSVTMSI